MWHVQITSSLQIISTLLGFLVIPSVLSLLLQVEDTLLREQIEQNNRWVQELEERQRQWQQERQAAAEAEVVKAIDVI